ncbi:hypothetical protein BU16DRAFT_140031 [Lophium mytilinum]|uniref:F-box domain-containing protein n=1 Tax=Lophium mytilinum TaxID=390894 RepID=A0A6A6QFB1_9PEZI|nr:hypothetical protein BU16DRAFT_140031 [Lophium mytilinum]
MKLLLDLPPELLIWTVSSLDPVKDRRTLYNLCLTSKALRPVAQPVLFSIFAHYDERREKHCEDELVPFSTPKLPLFQFARTLILRPDLAHKVQTLDTSAIRCHEFDGRDEVTDEDFDILTQAVLGMSSAASWQEYLRNFDLNACIGLLICLLPKLETFRFAVTEFNTAIAEESLSYLESWPGSVVQGTARPSPFSSLRSLHITGTGETYAFSNAFDLNIIGPILSLPTLEIFEAENCFRDDKYEWTAETFQCPARSLNISTLTFTNSAVSRAYMERLIAGCRSLRKFEYQRRKDTGSLGYPLRPCSLDEICSALQSHAASLWQVGLTIDEVEDFNLNLESCQYLKTLRLWVYGGSALRAQPLPQSLEQLWLRGNHPEVEDVFSILDFPLQKRRLPSFATIEVDATDFGSIVPSDFEHGDWSDACCRPPLTELETLKMYYTWKEAWLDGTDIELVFLNEPRFPNFDSSYVPSPEGLQIFQKIQDEGVSVNSSYSSDEDEEITHLQTCRFVQRKHDSKEDCHT